MKTRILVCGGRDADIDSAIVDACIADVVDEYNDTDVEFVSGAAKGGDRLGEAFAKQHGYTVVQFTPDWDKYGRAAGPIRNKQMINYIMESDNPIVIAFWDGHSAGTRNTIQLAQSNHIPVHIIRYNNNSSTITAGIQMNDGQIIYDWDRDEPEDILPLATQKVSKSTKKGHLFYYAFKANKGHDDWKEFLDTFKHSNDVEALKELTDHIANRLMMEFNSFECILYPKSSSILNELMIESLHMIDEFIPAYPVSKLSPKDVSFNWDLFEESFHGTSESHEKMVKRINSMLDRIHKSDTFSLQKQVYPMLRKYITGFLDIGDFEVALDDIINSQTILILDDIVTSGQTTSEIIRMLEDIGFEGDTVIFSLIYNK